MKINFWIIVFLIVLFGFEGSVCAFFWAIEVRSFFQMIETRRFSKQSKLTGSKVTGLEVVSNESLGFPSFDSFSKPFAVVLEQRWRISYIFLSKIKDVFLIALSDRSKDQKVDSSVDKVLEIEEERLKSSLRWEVSAFKWSSSAFSSK